MDQIDCVLCGDLAVGPDPKKKPSVIYKYECEKCGSYSVTHEALCNETLSGLTPRQRANTSAWVYRNPGYVFEYSDYSRLREIRTPLVSERLNLLLLAMSRDVFEIGMELAFKSHWVPESWSKNDLEADHLVSLLVASGYITKDAWGILLTAEGWKQIESLARSSFESKQCFVAMSFSPSMQKVYPLAIEPAIHGAGYTPLKIDESQHSNKIDDEIVAEIRKSKFLVADFTGHRGGVYFEAGFAKGLGREVIWTCSEEDFERLHFDIRQYNCIKWSPDNLEAFKKTLQLRIESVLGQGPLAQQITSTSDLV